MGIEELADTRSTRRTRSSTKGPTPTPVTPPTPKRQPATPSSSRRGKKKVGDDQEEAETVENDMVAVKASPKQTPPRKRQKLEDAINEEETKQPSVEDKSDLKIDVVDAVPSQEANGSIETMEVDELPVATVSSPIKEKSVPIEEKLVIESIPEESSQESVIAVEPAAVPEEKSLEETTKSEKAPVVTENSKCNEPLAIAEAMEVDSAKSPPKSTSEETVVNTKEVKVVPPEIIISEPEPTIDLSVVEEPKEAQPTVEAEITSTSEKADKISEGEETKAQVPDVISQESETVPETSTKTQEPAAEIPITKVQEEPTQVFEISSEQVVESPTSDPIEKLQAKSITEQSKIETTQGKNKSKLGH